MVTEIGPVDIDVPRDTSSSFEPKIVRKRQRRLSGVDEIVLSLTAKGLTTGEISAHFAEIYGTSVSKDTISTITDKVVAEMVDWCDRPLDRGRLSGPVHRCHPRQDQRWSGGQSSDHVVIGVTTAGERDILGLWAGEGGEGAKFWLRSGGGVSSVRGTDTESLGWETHRASVSNREKGDRCDVSDAEQGAEPVAA